MTKPLRAPFPYFGGKIKVAHSVWAAIGNVGHFVEPFAGSLAVLLNRPQPFTGSEVVNDADGLLVNVWRSIVMKPDEVAAAIDWPITEIDLTSRHLWLVNHKKEIAERLLGDPEWCDPRAAGWWIWGMKVWIGGGWCTGGGPWAVVNGRGYKHGKGAPGETVVKQRPKVNTRCWPSDDFNGGDDTVVQRLHRLAVRLRNVHVLYGDWSRVLSDGALSGQKTIGVFLDPPYLTSVRAEGVYAHDSPSISRDVRAWCLEHGDDPRFRIVLAGYDNEHDNYMPPTWHRVAWTGGTPNARKIVGPMSKVRDNRKRERLWLSPHCNVSAAIDETKQTYRIAPRSGPKVRR